MSCIQTDATELKIDILGMSFLALLIRMCSYAGIDRGVVYWRMLLLFCWLI